MGFKVIIAESARADLSEIVQRIARDNRTAAVRTGYAILARFQVLENFPLLGRIVPERNDPVWRELIHRPYRLMYHVDEARRVIHAARIWHGARGSVPDLKI